MTEPTTQGDLAPTTDPAAVGEPADSAAVGEPAAPAAAVASVAVPRI